MMTKEKIFAWEEEDRLAADGRTDGYRCVARFAPSSFTLGDCIILFILLCFSLSLFGCLSLSHGHGRVHLWLLLSGR